MEDEVEKNKSMKEAVAAWTKWGLQTWLWIELCPRPRNDMFYPPTSTSECDLIWVK